MYSGFDDEGAYELLLARRNRAGTPPPAPLDVYWRARLQAAKEAVTSHGITLTDSTADAMLVCDYADWLIDSRDQSGAMPQGLRTRLLQRFLEGDDADVS